MPYYQEEASNELLGTPHADKLNLQNESIEDEQSNSIKKKRVWIILLLLLLIIVVVLLVFLDSNDHILTRYPLETTAKCNDGSDAIYYYRKGDPKKWIVYFEGGFLYCFDETTCSNRNLVYPELMTSTLANGTLSPEGLLSSDCNVNPDFCDYSLGYIFYCSSDYFSGTVAAEDNDLGLYFQGEQLVTDSIAQFLKLGLADANDILLLGKGGGAVTIFRDGDKVTQQILDGLNGITDVKLRAVSDSGWISAYPPHSDAAAACTNYTYTEDCSILAGVQRGIELWQPHGCESDPSYTWQCFFPNYTFADLELKVLAITMEYDYAILDTSGCASLHGGFDDLGCVEWAQEFAQYFVEEEFLSTGKPDCFFPSCYNHEFIDKNEWAQTEIDGQNLLDVMRAWDNDGGSGLIFENEWIIANNPTCPA